jgi:hypothetical protein
MRLATSPNEVKYVSNHTAASQEVAKSAQSFTSPGFVRLLVIAGRAGAYGIGGMLDHDSACSADAFSDESAAPCWHSVCR